MFRLLIVASVSIVAVLLVAAILIAALYWPRRRE